jgi:hypothetical protein
MEFITSIAYQDINLIIISFLVLVFIFLIILIIRLEFRIKKLMGGKNGASLEKSFLESQKEIAQLKDFQNAMEKYLKIIDLRLSKSIQGIHNINFNAFSGMGSGAKSFASAFLNERGDGIILSSLHARDRVSIFAKQIKNYKSEIELTEEEKIALTKAQEYCKL